MGFLGVSMVIAYVGVCNVLLPDGTKCSASFPTKQACVMHKIKSQLPGHGKRSLARIITLGNQCLVCGAF